MEEALTKIATEAGPFVALAILIGWRATKAIGRFVDRLLAGFDRMTTQISDNTAALREHTRAAAESNAKLARAIARLDGKFDGVMLERETTPVGVPPPERPSVPRGRAAISDTDHPPLGEERRRTPPRGLPVPGGAYGHHRRPPDDSGE